MQVHALQDVILNRISNIRVMDRPPRAMSVPLTPHMVRYGQGALFDMGTHRACCLVESAIKHNEEMHGHVHTIYIEEFTSTPTESHLIVWVDSTPVNISP